MKKIITILTGSTVALGTFGFSALPALAAPITVYDAIPSSLAPNYPSQPFQAQQTNEFGDYVHLAGTDRNLESVTVTMVNWALASTPANQTFCATAGNCDSTGYFWPITVNVYANTLNANDVPTTLLGTKTATVHIPWRPVGDPTCPDTGYGAGFAYRAGDGQCYNGIASNVTIDMTSLGLTLPNDVIVGFAYNTQTYGSPPVGVDGPYNSLNIAVPANSSATVGIDDSSTSVFWNTNTQSYYTNSLCVAGTFCKDTNWTDSSGTTSYGTVAFSIAVTPPAPDSCTLVSDESTKVGTNPAVFSWVHSAWTHALDNISAHWIWNAFYATPGANDEVVTFTKTFYLAGTPSSVSLDIAADNYYSVLVNGSPASCDGSQLDNFSAPDTCNITSLVHSGSNTLNFTVTNAGGYGTDPQSNPGGLDYAVHIKGAMCTEPPPPVPASKDQCKMDGWRTLVDSDGHSFKNQGDCVSFVATGGKNKADTHGKTH